MPIHEHGNNKKYYQMIFGCQMNEHDSEVLAGMLEHMGYDRAETKEEADVLIALTCAVREKAEQKVLGQIGALKTFKEDNPDMVICIGGCMVQQEHVANKIYRNFRHVDLIFGTQNLKSFPELLTQVLEKRERVKEIEQHDNDIVEGIPHRRESNIKGWVVISYGCDNYCSYCIVPYVRGNQRSRSIESIREEVEQLAREGYQEITLLGQNVNSYGKDFGLSNGFVKLLHELETKVNGINRIRYMTSHPRDFDSELIDFLSSSEKVCEHVHLPVQAGSNKVLSRMGRGYTREHYINLVEEIRVKIPGVSITTDIIVGFPGETNEDFQDTIELVKGLKFDSAYTFVYSKREGTPASEYTDQVPEETKKERIQTLIELQKQNSLEINKTMEGYIYYVLVEGVSKNDETKLSGRTPTNKLVHFDGDSTMIGKIVPVYITQAGSWSIHGEYRWREYYG